MLCSDLGISPLISTGSPKSYAFALREHEEVFFKTGESTVIRVGQPLHVVDLDLIPHTQNLPEVPEHRDSKS